MSELSKKLRKKNGLQVRLPTCSFSNTDRSLRDPHSRHRKKHDKPYRCSLCSQGFALRNDLDRHRRRHLLLEPREFRCLWPSCDKVYARKDFLLKHMRKSHEGSTCSTLHFEETQERIRQLYMQSVKNVDKDPLVERKESVQLALMDATISGDDLKFNQLLVVEDEMIPFLTKFAAHGLIWAIEKGLEAAARRFIASSQQGISEVDVQAMVKAAGRGYDDIILLLLKHGAPVNCQFVCQFAFYYSWPTPLEIATFHGHTSTVRLLLAHGADVNGGNFPSRPLISAVQTGREDLVRILLEHGADPKLLSRATKCSALSLAEREGYERISRLLREHASHVSRRTL
jgi:hypothetical protein